MPGAPEGPVAQDGVWSHITPERLAGTRSAKQSWSPSAPPSEQSMRRRAARADVAVPAAERIAEVAVPVQRQRVLETADRHRRARLVLARPRSRRGSTRLRSATSTDRCCRRGGSCRTRRCRCSTRSRCGTRPGPRTTSGGAGSIPIENAAGLRNAVRVRDVDHRHGVLEAVEHVGAQRGSARGRHERDAARHLLAEVAAPTEPRSRRERIAIVLASTVKTRLEPIAVTTSVESSPEIAAA